MPAMLCALALLYLACFGLYHANAKRSAFEWVKASKAGGRCLQAISWGTALLALAGLAHAIGFERGFTIWLGLLSLAGGASLFIAARWPDRHRLSAYGAAGLAVFSAWAGV